MQNKKINGFRIEEKRDLYAQKGNLREFKKLYSKKNPSISNKNSDILWDDINFSRSGELKKSRIYIDKLSQILNFLKGKKGNLLDVGFGKGAMESRLKNSDFNLFGIDISNRSVNNVRKYVEGDFKKGNVLKIPFDSNCFNYVLCLDVMEHISPFNTFKALKEINRVLKTDFFLVISVPLNEGLEEMVKNGVNPNAHVRAYTPHILRRELELSGFVIEKEIYLSAFSKHYFFKKFLNQIFRMREPNLLILMAKKK